MTAHGGEGIDWQTRHSECLRADEAVVRSNEMNACNE